MSIERTITETNHKPISFLISITAIMTALTTVATVMISIYIPATFGFFNLGETMVYISSILFGPIVGGISGGVGSMIADFILGYASYAPGTLLIKGIEGFMVGFLYHELLKTQSEKSNKPILVISGLISFAIFIIGKYFYIGEAELVIFITINSELNYIIWIIIAILGFIFINLAYKMSKNKKFVNQIISMLLGGLLMVLGYYIYEFLILSVPLAYLEIPFNVLQSLIGIIIAIPLVNIIQKSIIIQN